MLLMSERLLDSYLAFLRDVRGLSARSIVDQERLLRWLLRFLNRRGVCAPREMTPQHVDAFLRWRGRKLSPVTLSHISSAVRGFLRFLRLRGLLRADAAGWVWRPRVFKLSGVPRFLPADKLRQLPARIPDSPAGERDRAYLALVLGLGLRPQEVAGLLIEDVQEDHGRLHLRAAKGGRPRFVPLTDQEARPLRKYIQTVRDPRSGYPHLFLTLRRPYRPLKATRTFAHRFRRYLRAIGCPCGSLYVFRHTFAQRLLEAGAPLAVIQNLMGHRELATTRIYLKVDLPALREVADNDAEDL